MTDDEARRYCDRKGLRYWSDPEGRWTLVAGPDDRLWPDAVSTHGDTLGQAVEVLQTWEGQRAALIARRARA